MREHFWMSKVFNSYAPTNRSTTPRGIYRRHENMKKRTYEARTREVEHGSFTPLILSATGGILCILQTFGFLAE